MVAAFADGEENNRTLWIANEINEVESGRYIVISYDFHSHVRTHFEHAHSLYKVIMTSKRFDPS